VLKQVLAEFFRAYRQDRQHRKARGSPHPNDPSAPGDSSAPLEQCWRVFGAPFDPARPFDVAVIMPTVGRPTALDAVVSVFAQSEALRIQLLIGVDVPLAPFSGLIAALESAPANVTTCLFYPGYSTSVRHGGLHPARDGGVLRTVLTYLANAQYVAYLDDDNWWAPNHLQSLLAAIAGKSWAFSHRWFVHPETRKVVCEDRWESVGPGKGVFRERFGGWVDPNCLMFDKLLCEPAIRWWSIPLPGDQKAMSADRNVYEFLQNSGPPGEVQGPTVFYAMQSDDGIHPHRLSVMGELYDKAGGDAFPERPLENA
jgi:hypothetical protein